MKFGFGKNIIVIDDVYVNYMKYEIYLINYFVVISLLIDIYFLELFLFGDVFCVVGKININGIMIIVLCFCMD